MNNPLARIEFFVLPAFLALAFACPAMVSAGSHDAPSVSVDAVFLQRSDAKDFSLAFDQTTGSESLNASDLRGDVAPGVRITLLEPLSDECLLEIGYLGIDGWISTADSVAGNYFIIGDQSRSGPFGSSYSAWNASRLHTVELNIRGQNDGWIQPLIGVRWLRFGDTYELDGIWNVGAGPEPYALSYETRNDLYGLQVGAVTRDIDLGAGLRLSAIGKVGVYIGDATSDAAFKASFLHFATESDAQDISVFAEVGPTATWALSDHIALRGGYQLYWLNGVALAPNQVPATDLAGESGGINNNGNVLLHGATAGIEVTW